MKLNTKFNISNNTLCALNFIKIIVNYYFNNAHLNTGKIVLNNLISTLHDITLKGS